MPLTAEERAARLQSRQKRKGQKDDPQHTNDPSLPETELANTSDNNIPKDVLASLKESAEKETTRPAKTSTDSEPGISQSLAHQEDTEPKREERNLRNMDPRVRENEKPVPVVTDISKRAIRERRPSDTIILPEENGTPVDDTPKSKDTVEKKKEGYGKYASGLRKADAQSDIMKRKEKYAAALEGVKMDEDDLDAPDTGINASEPDILSTVPVTRIKQQYLSTAQEEGKVVLPTEERPIPHDLQPLWPPPRDVVEGQRKPEVIQFEGKEEVPRREGVDAGHGDSVSNLKTQWQDLPEKYRTKPMGVNKPSVDIVSDKKWITHFKPVIDEGKTPEEPEWLKNVRHRRWMSTVKARFPEDEQEKVVFENRSTTPRKLKKPNPYTVMRSKSDLMESEFDEVMKRRRKRSDSTEEGSYLTKSASTFNKSASSFRSDSDVPDAGGVAVLGKVPVKGPIKEYLRNLSLERARNTMLKWSFSADVVDEPARFDLPKPIDLLIMDELEREQQWKYEQSRRRFLSEDEGADGMSIQSSSRVSFASDDDVHENGHKPAVFNDETAGFIPKLSDIQQKLKDEVEAKPTPKSTAIEDEAALLPKFEDAKEKYLAPVYEPYRSDVSKHPPFQFDDTEQFERVTKIKDKFPKPEAEQRDFTMPTTVMKGDKDFKKMMDLRKKQTDEATEDKAEAAAQEIKSLASDISRTFASDAPKGSAQEAAPEKKGTKTEDTVQQPKVEAKAEPQRKTSAPKTVQQMAPKETSSSTPTEKKAETKVMSLDDADGIKKDAVKSKPFQLKTPQSKQAKQQAESKEITFEDVADMDHSDTSNLKAFSDHRRKLRPVRKHAATSNPVKARQKREDLRTETDFLVSKAQRNHAKEAEDLERPVKTPLRKRHSEPSLAVEAVRALSATENLAKASTSLRITAKNVEGISTELKEFGGFLPVMLLQIKGYRHIQTRLVEPSAKSLNSGDAFVLVTPKSVYVWLGRSASIMKKAKAAEVSTIIVKQKDLGCNAKKSHFIDQDEESSVTGAVSFWKHLGGKTEVADAKNFPADEKYEKGMQATNIVYRVDYTSDPPILKRRDDLSGRVLSEKFMDPNHAYVLDFGAEVYLWLGRNCTRSARLKGMKLTQEVFDDKFKFKSNINPFDPKTVAKEAVTREVPRPSWALLGRMTARSETVLFREKFTDWPDHNVDYTKDFVKKPLSGSFTHLAVKKESPDEDPQGALADITERPASIFDLKSYDVTMMLEAPPEPSLILEGFNVGRGTGSVDDEGWRFQVCTIDVKTWHVKEYSYNPLPDEDIGHFHTAEGYVVRWKYCVKRVGVRTLKGHLSRNEGVGRDKVAYFFWQGKDSTVNEKGTAALITVEIDSDRGPQILVSQGKEPPCFPRLFDGKMVVHLGRREPQEDDDEEEDTCMFILRNEEPEEAYLLQVKTSTCALRSRTSFVVVDLIELLLYVWNGSKSCKAARQLTGNAGKQLLQWFNEKYPEDPLELKELEEGDEPELFWDALRGDRDHLSLQNDTRKYDFAMRVFGLSSSLGQFEAKEILTPTRSSTQTPPYPILQSQLYIAHQPALFLVDSHYELYMWQGWWPRDEEDNEGRASTTGSAQTRWSNDRRLAMATIKSYAQELKRDLSRTHIVFAGLEPKAFKALFPFWENRDDVTEINLKDGEKKGELLKLEQELARLSRDNYTLKELQQKPLPEGVDPTRLEMYLESTEFEKAFGITKKDYENIPAWKKLNLKKKANLF